MEQEKIDIIAFTPDHRIEGAIYVHIGGRISDFLNVPTKTFIPITDAKLYSRENKLIYEIPFMNVNKNYVTTMFPAQDSLKAEE